MEPIYVDLASESDDPVVTQIDSLCMTCQGKGSTRLLMTKIPHYKEVILTSFECADCGQRNTGVQSGSVQDKGVHFELLVTTMEDMSRQIVKSDHAVLTIPELDFEIPADGESGEITTVEGILQKARDNLKRGQDTRKQINENLAQQIEKFIDKLQIHLDLKETFTVVIEDPTGNSFVENLKAPYQDPQLKCTFFSRTKSQNDALGLQELSNVIEEEVEDQENVENGIDESRTNFTEEVLSFRTLCSNCSRPSSTKMKVTNIPHFKEAIIMATECDFCGCKTNEVKSGGGISEKGKKFTLNITNSRDMTRDVLKSETCGVLIPELGLDVGAGIFVGKFTTVEGLLTDIKEDLGRNPFLVGDSSTDDRKSRMATLVEDIQKVIDCSLSAHLVLDDPAGNSYLQSLCAPDKDPQLEEEDYERSYDQNEELGLNDMKTENYGEEADTAV